VLRRALGICTASLLLLVTQAVARDESPADVLLGPAQEEDTGPDYARDGYYLQFGYSWGKPSKLEKKLDRNKDQFALAPQASQQIVPERLVPFREIGTLAGMNRARTDRSDVNPHADSPCIGAASSNPCPISPLNDLTDDDGVFFPAVPFDNLVRAQNGDPSSPDPALQIGGRLRLQAVPGIRPGIPTEFLAPQLNTLNFPNSQNILVTLGSGGNNDNRPAQACGHGRTNSQLAEHCLTVVDTLGEILGNASVGNSHGVNLRAGSRVLPNLAIELQLEYMSEFKVDIPNYSQPGFLSPPPFLPLGGGRFVDESITYPSASATDKVNVELLALTVNLKVPILTGRIQPYGLVGGGIIFAFRDNAFPRYAIAPGFTSGNAYRFEEYVNVRDTGAVFRVGGGLDTYLTEHVFVSIEGTWVAAQGEAMNDLRYASITVGAGYRF